MNSNPVFTNLKPVGRFAHRPTAAPVTGAAAGGESGHDFTVAECEECGSNAQALLDALVAFFKDNPTA